MILEEKNAKDTQRPQDFIYNTYRARLEGGYTGEFVVTARDVGHANDIVSRYIQNNPQLAEQLVGIQRITKDDYTGEVSDTFGVAMNTIQKIG